MRSWLAGLVAVALVAMVMGCEDETTTTASAGPGAGGGGAGQGGGPGSGGAGGEGAGGMAGAGGGVTFARQFLYVANQTSGSITIYSIAEDGALTTVDDVTLGGGPGPLSLSPDQTRLYVGQVNGQSVSAFTLDTLDGTLEAIGGATGIGMSPVYVRVDATGNHLLVPSYGSNAVRTYAFAGDGSVNGTPISNLSPGTNPHAIALSPSNAHAFVPTTNSDVIAQYVFDAGAGTLTPNATAAEIAVPANTGPRHLVFHPTLDVLYVVNEHADSVTWFDYNPATGVLSAVDTLPTLPSGGTDPNNTCADIHVTADGAFVYASNRGDDSLARYVVDPGDGSLTENGHTPTEERPREFEVTPDSRYVYVAGEDSDMLASYRIEPDGTLTPLDVYSVGDRPMWVLAVGIPE